MDQTAFLSLARFEGNPPVAFHAITLPPGLSPALVGVVVGVVAALIGFGIVALVVKTKKPRPRGDVLVVPPYTTLEAVRSTPLPPRVFPAEPDALPPPPRMPFFPSTELSARALAKMGIPVAPFGERLSPASYTEVLPREIDHEHELADHDLISDDAEPPQLFTKILTPLPPKTVKNEAPKSEPIAMGVVPPKPPIAMGVVPPNPPIAVAPVLVVEGSNGTERPPPVVKKSESSPHPLGIIRRTSETFATPSSVVPAAVSSSGLVAAARIDDLSFDDGQTEIGEPYFDEPPQLHDPNRPKIRAITPAPPRFPAAKKGGAMIPTPTPPPMKVVRSTG